MRYYYIIIAKDEYENLICNGIINTFAPIEKEDYIPTETYDESLIGKMWTGSEWVENPNPPEEGDER